MIKTLQELPQKVLTDRPKTIAVAAAEEQDIMDIVKYFTDKRLAKFVLIGNADKINIMLSSNMTSKNQYQLSMPIIREKPQKNYFLSSRRQMRYSNEGEYSYLNFLQAVLNKEAGFRKGDLITQISVYNKFYGNGLQLLTDCAMIVSPSLEEKKNIIENAVELSLQLGYSQPRVALLSALEIVNPKMQDTIDAAVLSKMADRGQIKNALVDGPFALDNAVSPVAAEYKGIKSAVAGKADILVVPNLQVGNVLTKALVYFAKCNVAAAIVGASKPIIMTSRTDTVENKILSILLALYISDK